MKECNMQYPRVSGIVWGECGFEVCVVANAWGNVLVRLNWGECVGALELGRTRRFAPTCARCAGGVHFGYAILCGDIGGGVGVAGLCG
jgi:hypothetical protein